MKLLKVITQKTCFMFSSILFSFSFLIMFLQVVAFPIGISILDSLTRTQSLVFVFAPIAGAIIGVAGMLKFENEEEIKNEM